MRTRELLGAAALALLASVPAPVTAEDGMPPSIRWVMGTSLEILIRHPDDAVTSKARAAAFAEAQRLDNLLSSWLDTSPLSRLNAAAGEGPVSTDPELVLYLERARLDLERTDGAFDIGVGALVTAYRSGRADEGTIREVLAAGGLRHVRVEPPDLVELPVGVALDPGGDGKGVAVDAIVRILREHGVTNAFVNFGHSTVYGLGDDDGEPWRWAIADPAGHVVGTVVLRDRALSLSSALVSDEPGGPRRGHIVDPRDGRLVTDARHTAAVSPRATDAEVLSTALIVSGHGGRHLAGRFDGSGLAIFGEGEVPWMTGGFERAFAAAGPGEPAAAADSATPGD